MPSHSMYTKLIGAALEHPEVGEVPSNTGDALAELLRCRRRMTATLPGGSQSGWAAAAVADQVAYDVALIRMARQLGIACDLTEFDPPQHERVRLEQQLELRGIRLDELDTGADGGPTPLRRPSGP